MRYFIGDRVHFHNDSSLQGIIREVSNSSYGVKWDTSSDIYHHLDSDIVLIKRYKDIPAKEKYKHLFEDIR